MLIAICVLVLLAYIFDVTSAKTKVPTVIWLIALGFGAQKWVAHEGIVMPSLDRLLPLLGTVGLILIVLEGALDLELNIKKRKVLAQTSGLAAVGISVSVALLTVVLHQLAGYSWRICILNAIPLCVISSAIAVPSAKALNADLKEFVIYETSFSDILGVLLFNFVLLNTMLTGPAIGLFTAELGLVIVLSAIGTAALALLLRYIDHQIKFIPILILLVLLYAIEKHYHLPALVFILVFGLFLANVGQLKWPTVTKYLHPDILDKQVSKLHELLIEVAFLIRSLFFILLGFTLREQDLLDLDTLGLSIMVVSAFMLGRAGLLLILGKPLLPLLFIAPRGLITILLFISIPVQLSHPWVNNALVVQVILLMVLMMMIGLLVTPKPEPKLVAIETSQDIQED